MKITTKKLKSGVHSPKFFILILKISALYIIYIFITRIAIKILIIFRSIVLREKYIYKPV